MVALLNCDLAAEWVSGFRLLPLGAVNWPMICDCNISWSQSFVFTVVRVLQYACCGRGWPGNATIHKKKTLEHSQTMRGSRRGEGGPDIKITKI